MCPQFVDFDADGYTDIVTATFEGTAFLVRGSAAGWQEPQHITDAQGRNLVLSLFYDTENNAYDNADRSPEGVTNPADHCVSAMAMDWDDDGDFDMLLGAKEGRLYLRENAGEPGAPAFVGTNRQLLAGGEPFEVPGGLTAPRLVDWDGDGVEDLVCGSFAGGVYFYRNAGVKGIPAFEAPVTLIAVPENTHDGPKAPTSGVYADPVDYDNDGDLDLLVGGYAEWDPEAPQLTDEQRARLEELDAQVLALQEEMAAVSDRAQQAADEAETPEAAQAAMDAVFQSDETRAVHERWQQVFEEISTLRPQRQREAGVWLYRRR